MERKARHLVLAKPRTKSIQTFECELSYCQWTHRQPYLSPLQLHLSPYSTQQLSGHESWRQGSLLSCKVYGNLSMNWMNQWSSHILQYSNGVLRPALATASRWILDAVALRICCPESRAYLCQRFFSFFFTNNTWTVPTAVIDCRGGGFADSTAPAECVCGRLSERASRRETGRLFATLSLNMRSVRASLSPAVVPSGFILSSLIFH